jgi:hypothetical protein
VDENGWVRVFGLTKTEAEELLDWLEANGYPDRELCPQSEAGYMVRWHP